MKPQSVLNFQEWFEALHTTEKSQVAMMRLDPGRETGAEPESHAESDQVLLVLEGRIQGEVNREEMALEKGEFIIIPANVPHRFWNDSDASALTFNVYAPPAYPPDAKG